MAKTRENSAKVGGAFEKLIELSMTGRFYRVPLPRLGARMVPVRGRWQLVRVKMPYDYLAIHTNTGRSVAFDAKSSKLLCRFPMKNVEPHQVKNLVEAGRHGVISGLLIEARDPSIATVFWLPWKALFLMRDEPSIEWSDPRLIKIGRINEVIDLERILP